MSETYTPPLRCNNCKRACWLKIPIGISIEEYGEKESPYCEYCKCPIIKIKDKKEE